VADFHSRAVVSVYIAFGLIGVAVEGVKAVTVVEASSCSASRPATKRALLLKSADHRVYSGLVFDKFHRGAH